MTCAGLRHAPRAGKTICVSALRCERLRDGAGETVTLPGADILPPCYAAKTAIL